ncbi:hypothetical protein NLI96_g561 [Meripilus lineatus]|uniref:Arrestin-like N-terminal domain-containing protein n=1 Tax=Meripilus lineatus TaxID=2056292 RepID=A0AAD5YNT5_9APHY|nr:hypothetical protein NLI96_g561 [Physisporinus lineatus]
MSIVLHLADERRLRVAGETIHGEVELHIPEIIKDGVEEVHVKFRGRVYARVEQSLGTTSIPHHGNIYIAKDEISVWNKSGSLTGHSGGTLWVPFQFVIPLDAKPSCAGGKWGALGSVSYIIKAVGVRPGKTTKNRRVTKAFAVVPPDPAGSQLRESLSAGWSGPFRTLSKSIALRKGIWGSHSEAKIDLSYPDVPVLPLFADIPFTLSIITETKEMKYDAADQHKDVFPVPPSNADNITFLLRRKVEMKVNGLSEERWETLAQLGALGKASPELSSETNPRDVSLTSEKWWIPTENDKQVGAWRQETTIKSTFRLRSTPTFSTPVFSARNYLHVKVDFPGMKNEIKEDFPIQISSAVVAPTAKEVEVGDIDEALENNLDLSQPYWDGEMWNEKHEASGLFKLNRLRGA